MEVLMTFFFLLIIIGCTSRGAPRSGSAGIPIGLALTLIHLVFDSGDQHVRSIRPAAPDQRCSLAAS